MAAAMISCGFCPATKMRTEVLGIISSATTGTPNSSPYTVCIALDYLDLAGEHESNIKDRIIAGIVKYLASGAYL